MDRQARRTRLSSLDRRAGQGWGGGGHGSAADTQRVPASKGRSWVSISSQVFRYSLQKLAYTVSRTGRHVLGERRQRAPN